MPLYDFCCKKCAEKFEAFATFSERVLACPLCGGIADRLVSAPTIRPPMQPYTSPVTGKWVEGERMRREDLARNNCIPYDPEMKTDAVRKQAEDAAKIDKLVDTAVEKAVVQLTA